VQTFSDYIVFADESGDHGLEDVNPQYPVFVLSFCIFHETQYVERVVPATSNVSSEGMPRRAILITLHWPELQAEFDRICAGVNFNRACLPLRLVFAGKQANATGLQMADLVARPVGMRTLRPEQANRAFDALAGKFHCNRRGESKGWGD
jgi:hypothetical protein